MIDSVFDFMFPFDGDICMLVQNFGLIYSFVVIAAFLILTLVHRIRDDWPINKHNSVFLLAVSNGMTTYMASYCWFLGIILQINFLVFGLWDNNCKSDSSTKIYDDFGISSYNEERQQIQKINYILMTDEEREIWNKKYGKAAYKISNVKLILSIFFHRQ